MKIKKALQYIVPFLVAGSMALGCDNVSVKNSFRLDNIPKTREGVVETARNIKRIYDECLNIPNCDKTAYLNETAKLAGHFMKRKGIDVENIDITADETNVPENKRNKLGFFSPNDGFIWINVLNSEGNLKAPLSVYNTFSHEMGHCVHDYKYGNKDNNVEVISEFFDTYFPVELLKEYYNDKTINGFFKGRTFYDNFWGLDEMSYSKEECNIKDEKLCKSITAEIKQIINFGKNNGDFNAVLDTLATNYQDSTKVTDDVYRDVKDGTFCGDLTQGIKAYHDFVYQEAKEDKTIQGFIGDELWTPCSEVEDLAV